MDFGYMFSGFTCCSAKLLPAKLQEGPLGRKISTCKNLAEQIMVENVIWTKHNLLFSRKRRLAKNNIRPELSFGRTDHLAEMDKQPAKMILCLKKSFGQNGQWPFA